MIAPPRVASAAEDLANSLTHGLGVIASIVGLVVLVALATLRGGPLEITAVSIFGASLVLLYTASTLYHSIPIPAAKRVLKVIDHSAIYVLIAGTYTPFALVLLSGSARWWLFGSIWALALAGVGFKLFTTGRFKRLSVALYLAMGWLVVGFTEPVLAAVPAAALWWMLAGGLAYTLGVVFFVWESLPFHHAIWHLFVLAGSVLHYLAVFWYVL